MDPLKYLDAGHSGPSSESSTASIELKTLQDIPVTPAADDPHRKDVYEVDQNEAESEDDSADEDDGRRALLSHDRPRGRERPLSPSPTASVWAQVKRIVIEVFAPSRNNPARILI